MTSFIVALDVVSDSLLMIYEVYSPHRQHGQYST